MPPFSGNQRPDLLTYLMNMSVVLRAPREIHLCRSFSNVPRLPSFLKVLQDLHVLLTFDQVQDTLHLPCKMPAERQKVVPTCGGNALRATTVTLFGHLNSENGSEAEVLRTF